MGALATAVTARLSNQRLVELTNPDVEGATTVNATLLAAAESDAQSEWPLLTGTDPFDPTNATHLAIGIMGVVSRLYDYKGLPRSPVAQAARDEWEKLCGRFARTKGGLAWQSPLTDSVLLPTTPQGSPAPYFDPSNLRDLVPRSPYGGTLQDPPPVSLP